MQCDPLGYWDSNNLYQYVLNSPINFIDPTGKSLEGILGPGFIIIWITVLIFTMQHQQTQTCPPTQIDVPEWIPITIPVLLPIAGYPHIILSQRKGERGHTGKADGTPNPFKHKKPHPTDPTKVQEKDPHTGKTVDKPKPPGFDEWWKNKYGK